MHDLRTPPSRPVLALTLAVAVLVSGCAQTYEPDVSDCDCAAGASCAAGMCLADCGTDLAAIISTLHPSVSIVQSFCLDLAEGPIGAFLRPDGALDILHAHVSTEGRDTTVVLDAFVATVETGALGAGVACTTTTFRADDDGATVSLSRDLAVSPDGRFAAWGLRAALDEPGASSRDAGDAWSVARRDGCAIETHPFPRVEGVAFGSDSRGPHVLVSGGLGGPVYMDGVFLDGRRVLAESTPGSIWRLGDSVLVGGVLGHGVAPATLLPLASVGAGTELRRGEDGVVSGDAQTHRFVWLEGRGVVSEDRRSDAGGGLEARSLEVRADRLVFGEPVSLAGPAVTAVFPVVGSRRFLLRHAGGLLLVE